VKEYAVKWTKNARKDLREIKKFIAKDSPWYSISVTADIVVASGQIGQNPHRYTVCPEWRSEKTRHKLIHGYRIIFDIKLNHIVILGVIHEKRLLENVSNQRFK
jgi:plasmid stabilization system protein ParE